MISLIKLSREMQQQGASDGRFCFAGWKARHFLHVSCTPGCTACWFSFVFPLHQPPCPDAAALPNRFVLFHCVFLQVRRVRASAGLAGAASSKAFLGRRASINPIFSPADCTTKLIPWLGKASQLRTSSGAHKHGHSTSSPEGFPSIWPCCPYLASLLCLPVLGRVAAVPRLVSPSHKARVKVSGCLPAEAAVQIN